MLILQCQLERIEELKIKNIEILKKDFKNIDKKFDKIIFTAGILHSKEKIIEEFAQKYLNENGILVCPYQSGHWL